MEVRIFNVKGGGRGCDITVPAFSAEHDSVQQKLDELAFVYILTFSGEHATFRCYGLQAEQIKAIQDYFTNV